LGGIIPGVQRFATGGEVSDLSLEQQLIQAKRDLANAISSMPAYKSGSGRDNETYNMMQKQGALARARIKFLEEQINKAYIQGTGSSGSGTSGSTGGTSLPVNVQIDTDQLQAALLEIETKVKEQIEQAQQRFNETTLAATDRATEAVTKSLERYADAVARIQADTLQFDESIEDRIRNIRRAGFTEEEQRVDIIKQIREKQHAAEEAIAAGDLERAARLNGELIALAQLISVEAKDAAGNVIVSQKAAATQAIGFLRIAQTLNAQIAAQKQVLVTNVKNTELAAITATKNAEIAAIQAVLDQRLAAIEKARLASVAAAQTTSTSSSSSRSSGGSSTSTKTAQLNRLQSQISGLAGSLNNYRYGSSFYNDAAAKLALLKQRYTALLNSGTGFNTGGSVPGVGNSDTVRAMLTPGEFVIKKASVAKYGQGFLSAINAGVLPATQRFASGGAVNNVKESIAVTLNMGGNQAEGMFEDNDSTRALIDALNEASLVS